MRSNALKIFTITPVFYWNRIVLKLIPFISTIYKLSMIIQKLAPVHAKLKLKTEDEPLEYFEFRVQKQVSLVFPQTTKNKKFLNQHCAVQKRLAKSKTKSHLLSPMRSSHLSSSLPHPPPPGTHTQLHTHNVFRRLQWT